MLLMFLEEEEREGRRRGRVGRWRRRRRCNEYEQEAGGSDGWEDQDLGQAIPRGEWLIMEPGSHGRLFRLSLGPRQGRGATA